MKRILFILISFAVIIVFLSLVVAFIKYKVKGDLKDSPIAFSSTPTPGISQPITAEKTGIFIPYWALSGDLSENSSTELYYFGIAPTENGIDIEDSGYKALGKFSELKKDNTAYLTLRLIDRDINFAVLEDKRLQGQIVDETIEVAEEYGFDGVLLDLEISALPFDSVIKDGNDLVTAFRKATKESNLKLAVAVYGDTFFRLRPLDIKHIADNADSVLVMAYDFHKSTGNPGPNFPLSGVDSYGYDLAALINDFLRNTPTDKLTMVFGMFGYDWEVDDKDQPIENGRSLSLLQAESRLIDSCSYTKCEWARDVLSGEVRATYIDDEGKKHIVWFEDEESVRRKKEFLMRRGINSFSYWAHSYY